MLKQYLTYFQTAEINSTFYALPKTNFIKHIAGGAVPAKEYFDAPGLNYESHRVRFIFIISRPGGNRRIFDFQCLQF